MGRKTFFNKITSPELTSKINIENSKLISSFLKEKSIRISETTQLVYKSNLNIFFTWNLLHNNNKFFIDIKKIEFSNFFSFCSEVLRQSPLRMASLRSILSSFSLFIEKFYDDEYPTFRNVILNVIESFNKEPVRIKTILTEEQVEMLLKEVFSVDKQKACWLALTLTSGARFSETLRFNTNTINVNNLAFGDLFLETTEQIKTKGRGKSGKLLYKYLLRDKFLPYYTAWIEERTVILKQKHLNHNSLFIKYDGTPATIGSIRLWFDEFTHILGVPFYPHALRHYLVTLLSRKGIPYSLIKEIVGWSSLEMCSIYDDTLPKEREWKELQNLKSL